MEPAPPTRFDFPFQPYPAQQLLMAALYETALHGTQRAEDGLAGAAVGIFESPTGTGKSLSIICSLLKWLEEQEQAMMNPQPKNQAKPASSTAPSSNAASVDGFPDWLTAFTMENDSSKKARAMELAHRTVTQRISAAKAASTRETSTHRELLHASASRAPAASSAARQPAAVRDADDIDCLDEYHSDDESAGGSRRELDPEASSDDEEELDLPQRLEFPKILYSSRTHSQLSQFMTEIRKTRYAHVRCITVSSRRNLCINPEVYTLESDLKLNERCLELLRNQHKTKRTDTNQPAKRSRGKDAESSKESSSCGSGCPYYSSRDALRFRDHALAEIRDVEELASLGRRMHTCPYYGMRKSIEWAQVVAMPYSVLLQPQARSAVGVDVRGNIVVVDEAHNLIEAINELHSVQLTVAQMRVAQRQLSEYLDRFKFKLAGKNLYYVNVLLTILQSLIRYATETSEDELTTEAATAWTGSGRPSKAGNSDEIFRISDFMFRTRLEHANLFKVGRFIVRSEIARKVCSYFDRKAQAEAAAAGGGGGGRKEEDVAGSRFAVQDVARFLSAVTSRDVQGRVVVRRRPSAPETGMYRFVVLDSKAYFDDIIRDARAVILVGGTMQPFDHVRSHLFPDVDSDRLHTFACDHVIPAEQVKAIALCCGPNGREFDFRLSNRNDSTQLDQLAAALLQIRSSVPHGVVCFFASYSYMDAVLAKLETSGQLGELRSRTAVFHEPRHAKDLEKLLARYAEQAVSDRGAIIFCVVGGKLSEGINFSDDLARAVVVVGLPYPDMRDIELQQRMQQLDQRRNGWGREYYESLCMRAVNQSIGRSIRHANDYAAIVLIDARYRQQRIQAQLPQWVRRSLRTVDRFPELAEQLDAFRQCVHDRR